jgi:hypothetical protein
VAHAGERARERLDLVPILRVVQELERDHGTPDQRESTHDPGNRFSGADDLAAAAYRGVQLGISREPSGKGPGVYRQYDRRPDHNRGANGRKTLRSADDLSSPAVGDAR